MVTAAPAGGTERLAWLDGLRGWATVAVVYYHLGPRAVLDPPLWIRDWLDLGKYGVVVFFLLSGYVIPMSLEHSGSLRRFWIGRVFRLYPAFLVAATAMLLLFALSDRPVPTRLAAAPVTGTLAHASMLQGLLGVSNLVPVYWTLSYEMIFYLLAAGLYAFGLHRYGAWVAAGLAAAALVGGPRLPAALLTGDGDDRRCAVALALVALLVVTVAGYTSGRRRVTIVCATLGLAVILLPLVNGGATDARASWQSLVLLALMFAGTVVYRMERRLLGRVAGAAALAAVAVSGLAGGWWYLPAGSRAPWLVTLVLGAGTFAVAYALRRVRVPRVAVWLGHTSYSVYLLHLVFMYAAMEMVPGLVHRPLPVQVTVVVLYLVALFTAGWLSYRWVERPGQRLGRRLADLLDARLGPDLAAAGRPASRVLPPRSAPPRSAPARSGSRRPVRPEVVPPRPGPPARSISDVLPGRAPWSTANVRPGPAPGSTAHMRPGPTPGSIADTRIGPSVSAGPRGGNGVRGGAAEQAPQWSPERDSARSQADGPPTAIVES